MATRMKDWITMIGDVNWEDYGGSWGRKAKDGSWFVLRFTNLEDACGDDAPVKYECDVVQVDLANIPENELKSAIESCGLEEFFADPNTTEDQMELALVEACVGYGIYAPLDSVEGDHYPDRIRAQARRIADDLMEDSEALEDRLDRPVNAIGSTAREFGQGNALGGLTRYAKDVQSTGEADDPMKNLMLKMYGIPVEKLQEDAGKPLVKTIKQSELTAECWIVQMQGTDACFTCEARNTDECGGKDIRRTGKNEKGIAVGSNGL